MLLLLAPVEHWISEALHLVAHVHFGSDAEVYFLFDVFSFCIFYCFLDAFAFQHALKVFKILLHGVLPVLALDSFISLLFHFFGGSVVCIGKSILNELFAVISDSIEII